MDFTELRDKVHNNKPNPDGYECILAFDPGHTTGWALFTFGDLTQAGQIDTTTIANAAKSVGDLFQSFAPDIIVVEDYRIYKWKQKQHVGSDMLTTRVIGCIETIAYQFGDNPVVKQGANIGKGFCTDDKLKAWGDEYWSSGMRHARDAIRHGCYFVLFGTNENITKSGTNTTTMGN